MLLSDDIAWCQFSTDDWICSSLFYSDKTCLLLLLFFLFGGLTPRQRPIKDVMRVSLVLSRLKEAGSVGA